VYTRENAHTGEQIWASRAYIRDNESAVSRGFPAGAVVALDAETGERRWLHRCRAPVGTAPAVAGGLVQVGTGNHLVALSAATGARQQRRRPGWFAGLVASPSVAGTMLLAGTAEGWLYAMNVLLPPADSP
jgi:outer membrane protein assembly factor BamB